MKRKDDIKRTALKKECDNNSEISQLKAQMIEMQIEINLLNETLNVLKKDRGVNLRFLKNREKTAMI
jgi:hypothetical protein